MNQAPNSEQGPQLDDYLSLFAPYNEQLRDFQGSETRYGSRFVLLFRQVLRLLEQGSSFNSQLPQPFRLVAQGYLSRDHATVRHFSYEENRHLFLSDLYDWLRIHERGRKMRGN